MSSTLNRLRRLHSAGKKSSKKSESKVSSSPESGLEQQPSSSPAPSEPKFILPKEGTPRPAVPSVADTLESYTTSDQPLDEVIGGIELQNAGGVCYAVAYAIPLHAARGNHCLRDLLHHNVDSLHPFHPNFNLADDANFGSAAFLDTETTGLGGGAGVYTFMVGVGRFESHPTASSDAELPDTHLTQAELWNPSSYRLSEQPEPEREPSHFVVRQLFMRRPSEECSLLIVLAELLQGCSMTLTFNGRTFDLPLLRTRYQQNRHLLPRQDIDGAMLLQDDGTHFDLLIPSRRLWRRRLDSCRLTRLEQHILQHQRTSDDVPGHLIPLLYSQFVRDPNGAAGAMPGVFYHNREDIVSMVGLTTEVYTLFRQIDAGEVGINADGLHGLDWLSLGCCFEAINHRERAEFAFNRALTLLGNEDDSLRGRAEGYRRLSFLHKRHGNWTQATAIWQQWLSTIDGPDLTPFIELAKYCEWQARDLEQAEMWTRWALHSLGQQATTGSKARTLTEALDYRLARIQRKRADSDSA